MLTLQSLRRKPPTFHFEADQADRQRDASIMGCLITIGEKAGHPRRPVKYQRRIADVRINAQPQTRQRER